MCFPGRRIIIIHIEGKLIFMDANERNGEQWDYTMITVRTVSKTEAEGEAFLRD